MADYNYEQCKKAFGSCADLALKAKTPAEKKHWEQMESVWKARATDALDREDYGTK